MTSPSDDKSPLERALDLLVYAPVGAALAARDLLPTLVERGRQQVANQVTMARMMGQFAVKQGGTDLEKAFGRAREQAAATLRTLGVVPPDPNGRAPAAPRAEPAPPQAPPRPTSGPGADALPIPDYDSLSASQVVPRLAALERAELEAVRAYESAHRGRKTILNRISQLQAG